MMTEILLGVLSIVLPVVSGFVIKTLKSLANKYDLEEFVDFEYWIEERVIHIIEAVEEWAAALVKEGSDGTKGAKPTSEAKLKRAVSHIVNQTGISEEEAEDLVHSKLRSKRMGASDKIASRE